MQFASTVVWYLPWKAIAYLLKPNTPFAYRTFAMRSGGRILHRIYRSTYYPHTSLFQLALKWAYNTYFTVLLTGEGGGSIVFRRMII